MKSNLACDWPGISLELAIRESAERWSRTRLSSRSDSIQEAASDPWSASLQIPTGPSGPAFQTPTTGLFFQHYVVEMGPNLLPVPMHKNPFVSVILPLAYSDDLVRQCVAALWHKPLLPRPDQIRPPGLD